MTDDINIASPFIQKADERKYTLGIVYAPDVVDLQGDYATADEIEKACWAFNRTLQGLGEVAKGALGLQHRNWADSNGAIVESYIAPANMTIDGQTVTKGTWLMGCVWSDAIWKKIQAGEVTGLSMGGRAERTETEIA